MQKDRRPGKKFPKKKFQGPKKEAPKLKEGYYRCVAKTLAGLEEMQAEELKRLGFENVSPMKRAVRFETDLEGIYKANLACRTALSILVNISNFRFRNSDDFYKQVKNIVWEDIFEVRKTISIKTAVFSNIFKNTQYPALVAKDAIADRFREKFKKRPNVDKERPDVVIDVYISENRATISLNSSGQPLFMRGYRNMAFAAPLNECLAAGLIYLTGWKADSNFINPMCGSGTLIAEAGMMAYNIHAQKMREDFSFQNWKNYDEGAFQKVRKNLESEEKSDVDIKLEASDISNRAISITRNTLAKLWLDDKVELTKMNVMKAKVNTKDGLIILNPPYDERLQEDDIEQMYSGIGDTLKTQYTGHRAFIFSSHIEALKNVGLKTSSRRELYNGKIPCKYFGYDLYEGSKKGKDEK